MINKLAPARCGGGGMALMGWWGLSWGVVAARVEWWRRCGGFVGGLFFWIGC